jgi:TfoX N-terminal domain
MSEDPLLGRLRKILTGKSVTEQKMFGGTCFMLDGNMVVGASKRGLLVRVGKDEHHAAVARPHARPMEMGGRTMQGFIFVAPEGTASDKDLGAWVGRARAFVETLPPKVEAKTKKPAKKAPAKTAPAKKPARKAAKSR